MTIHIFGIRHHGPGCARSLAAALDALAPDVIVVEGPADAAEALPLIARDEMRPPVALLLYPQDEPRRASFFPLALFSPEWQAFRWALARQIPLRLMDLPQGIQIAMARDAEAKPAEPSGEDGTEADDGSATEEKPAATESQPPTWRTDPLALLAEAAGYKDHELWWEHQIERRVDPTDLFAAIAEAMRSVREEIPEQLPRDVLREAFMRQTIRGVTKEGFSNIAVVCGAWHAPVLDEPAIAGKRPGLTAKDDGARLKGLPKTKIAATWIPWSHSRLSYRSGYGAGVWSPGWYAHLWQTPEEAPLRWIATAARLLREKDLDASSASVIETVRLADALAAMRELRSPGLAELNEAILTVLCHGDSAPMRLIRSRLEIGELLGEVPPDAPLAPLARDLEQRQKSYRLKPTTEIQALDLDLRKPNELARSQLLHQLNLLGIPWGELQSTGGKASTFHEVWRLQWRPDFAVDLIAANVWGNTLEAAAAAKVISDAVAAKELAALTTLLDAAILSGLEAAVEPLLGLVQSQAALAADVRHLMDALPPLARVARYGDVRGTCRGQLEPIITGLLQRALVGLTAACAGLDDEAADRMLQSMAGVQEALDVLCRDDLTAEWRDKLRVVLESDLHGLLRGWACRLLLEQHVLGDEELYRCTRLALSPANDALTSAAWATGLLRGSGLVLLHQERVWSVFNDWISELSAEAFQELLPLIRRAFSGFTGPERRQMGEKVKHLRAGGAAPVRRSVADGDNARFNHERARKILPVLAQILGVKADST